MNNNWWESLNSSSSMEAFALVVNIHSGSTVAGRSWERRRGPKKWSISTSFELDHYNSK